MTSAASVSLRIARTKPLVTGTPTTTAISSNAEPEQEQLLPRLPHFAERQRARLARHHVPGRLGEARRSPASSRLQAAAPASPAGRRRRRARCRRCRRSRRTGPRWSRRRARILVSSGADRSTIAGEHAVGLAAGVQHRRREQRVRSGEQDVGAESARDERALARVHLGDERMRGERLADPRLARRLGPQHLAAAIEEQRAAGEHRRLEEEVVQGGPGRDAARVGRVLDRAEAVGHARAGG